ncbi:UNVERIFIED_CONTAM: hypothetical protein Scaly_1507300 [Sesamum calycinum]|uniref:Uncharacterized protein n=1 Tax=Sesamum calycinum TaxID=2727403 RepID=A0AAW2PRJ0_9LAMI
MVQEYFEAITVPPLQEVQTPVAHEEEGFWSNYNQDGVLDDGTRSASIDVGPSSYYNEAPYDYVFGVADRFYDVVHAAKQPLWNGCTQSQLASLAKLNDCILYWNDDIDLDYCIFCGKARYKLIREQNLYHKKTLHAIFRYLPLTPRLQRLYASESIAEEMTWHANPHMEDRSMYQPSNAEHGGILTGHIPILQQNPIILD